MIQKKSIELLKGCKLSSAEYFSRHPPDFILYISSHTIKKPLISLLLVITILYFKHTTTANR